MDEIIIKSTRNQLIDFKESFLWDDLQKELNRLSERSQAEYDLVGEPYIDKDGSKVSPTSSETLIHLGDIKGRRKAIQYFLSIPDIFLSILEDKKNDSERK